WPTASLFEEPWPPAVPRRRAARRGASHPCQRGTCDGRAFGQSADGLRAGSEGAGRGAAGSPGRRGRERGWIDAPEGERTSTSKGRCSTVHLVSTNRHLPPNTASRVSEAEHIAGHAALDQPQVEALTAHPTRMASCSPRDS